MWIFLIEKGYNTFWLGTYSKTTNTILTWSGWQTNFTKIFQQTYVNNELSSEHYEKCYVFFFDEKPTKQQLKLKNLKRKFPEEFI